MLAILLMIATTNVDLNLITLAAYMDHRARLTDQFAPETVPTDQVGKDFALTFTIGSGDSTGPGLPSTSYSYKDGALTFLVSQGGRGGIDQIVFTDPAKIMSQSTYVGTNAYGARAKVISRWLLSRGLAALSAPSGEPASSFSSEVSIQPYKHDYWLRLTVPPLEARKIALDTVLLVEGKYTRLEDGSVAKCKSTVVNPTVADPEESFDLECFAAGNVTRVAFVRKSSGQVLKEWRS